jgi:hypothetical protein
VGHQLAGVPMHHVDTEAIALMAANFEAMIAS